MVLEQLVKEVERGYVPLLTKLVKDELDRRCAAIDDIVVVQYQVAANRHTEEAIDTIKSAVLELVRSPLGDLGRKLGVLSAKPEPEPAAEPAADPTAEAEAEAEAGGKLVEAGG